MGIPPQPSHRPACDCLTGLIRDHGRMATFVAAAIDAVSTETRRAFAREIALEVWQLQTQVRQCELLDMLHEHGLYARLDTTRPHELFIGPRDQPIPDEVKESIRENKGLIKDALRMNGKDQKGVVKDLLTDGLWQRVVRNATAALAAQGRTAKKESA